MRAGDVLFTIDPRPYRAALRPGRGACSRVTRRCSPRPRTTLVGTPISSRRTSSPASSSTRSRPNAAALRATVAADRATVESARLDLSFCTIAAPVSGPHREPDGQGRQPGQGQRRQADGDHQPDACRSTSPSRSRRSSCRRCCSAAPTAVGVEAVDSRGRRAAGVRHAHVHRQRGRHGDQHDPPQGDLREPGRAAVAGSVRRRRADARRGGRPSRRARGGGADRASRGSSSSWSRTTSRSSCARCRSSSRCIERDSIIASGLAGGETVVTDGQLRLVPGAPRRGQGGRFGDAARAGHEHLRAVHPPAGHDDAGHGRRS